MKKIIKGSLVKFHSPLPDEDPNQIYTVMELIEDSERPRADIKPINTGLNFPPINTVPLEDLEIVKL